MKTIKNLSDLHASFEKHDDFYIIVEGKKHILPLGHLLSMQLASIMKLISEHGLFSDMHVKDGKDMSVTVKNDWFAKSKG